jgi:hypothetical protein
LEVADEGLSLLRPATDPASGQMIQPSAGRVGEVERESFDDEQVVPHPSSVARQPIVL